MTIKNQEYVSLPLMTISDAAKYMGVGRKIIYQLIRHAVYADDHEFFSFFKNHTFIDLYTNLYSPFP